MADLTPSQLAWLRSEVGTSPTDDDLEAAYVRLGSVRDVAIESLRDRRARLLESPLSVNVPGVASVNNAENVKAIERRISALVKLDDDPTSTPGEDTDGGAAIAAIFSTLQLTRSRRR